MQVWKVLWTTALLVAGSGFALVTLVVIVKGGRDLREMLRALKRGR
jgi:hypothetical protein